MIPNQASKLTLIVAIVWVLPIAAAGVASVGTLMGWLIVSVLAFGPAAVLLYCAKELPQTTSQVIHDARR